MEQPIRRQMKFNINKCKIMHMKGKIISNFVNNNRY